MVLNFIGKNSGFGEKNNSAYIEYKNKFILIDCGLTVFTEIKDKFDFNKYNEIDVIITHLHNDHAGSLSQFILYIWFVYGKKVTIYSKCKNINEYLKITGTTEEAYKIENQKCNLKFIETEHVKEIDSYGFELKMNDKKIVYTGDTNTLNPFYKYLDNADEFYVDVSKNGGVHLKIDNVINNLEQIKNKGTEVILMHIDDVEYMKNYTKNKFII